MLRLAGATLVEVTFFLYNQGSGVLLVLMIIAFWDSCVIV